MFIFLAITGGLGWRVGYGMRVVGGVCIEGGGWGMEYGRWEGYVMRVVGGICTEVGRVGREVWVIVQLPYYNPHPTY